MMEIVGDIGLVATFLLVLLSLFLFTAPSKNKLPNVFFGLFLLVTSLDFSALFAASFYGNHLFLNDVRIASVLLQMPLFYLYVRAICYHNFRLSALQLVHVIPFAAFFVVRPSDDSMLYEYAAQAQYYFYIIAVFYELRKYRHLQLENYALHSKTYQWLMTTTVLFLTGNCFVLFRSYYEKLNNNESLAFLNLGISLFGLGVICWFTLKAMRNPELFKRIDQDIKPLAKSEVGANEKGKEEHKEEIEHLLAYMSANKPYLEETLTLQMLAEKTGIPDKQLSFLINRVLDKHFFDFINTYRVEEAKTLLEDKGLNIQEIMYQVGFNSKSSFYTAFKKQTATTPSNYRKSIG